MPKWSRHVPTLHVTSRNLTYVRNFRRYAGTHPWSGQKMWLLNVCKTCSLHISFSHFPFPLLIFLLFSPFFPPLFLSLSALLPQLFSFILANVMYSSSLFYFPILLRSSLDRPPFCLRFFYFPYFSLLFFCLILTSRISAAWKFVSETSRYNAPIVRHSSSKSTTRTHH